MFGLANTPGTSTPRVTRLSESPARTTGRLTAWTGPVPVSGGEGLTGLTDLTARNRPAELPSAPAAGDGGRPARARPAGATAMGHG